jgi:hypothetical protein
MTVTLDMRARDLRIDFDFDMSVYPPNGEVAPLDGHKRRKNTLKVYLNTRHL